MSVARERAKRAWRGSARRAGGAWIGCDVGGQSVKAVLLAGDRTVLAETGRPTGLDIDAERLVATLADVCETLSATPDAPVVDANVGVGIAGVMARDGVLAGSPNLPLLVGERVRSVLESGLGRPVAIDNDANCAALAEGWGGGAAGARDFLLVTLGSGIGSGLVLGGELWHGATGYACELGHTVVARGGRPCGCGNLGCLEAYASESAARSFVAESSGELATRVERCIVEKGHGYAQALFALADAGDVAAEKIVATMVSTLGVGLASAVNLLDVPTIVIGGGIAPAVLGRERELREAMDASLFARSESTVALLAASCGADAGAVGAARLAMLAAQAGASR